ERFAPDTVGEIVGNELALGQVAINFLSFFAADVDRPKDVAARQVKEAGHLAENSPLCSLADAGRAEQQSSLIAGRVGHSGPFNLPSIIAEAHGPQPMGFRSDTISARRERFYRASIATVAPTSTLSETSSIVGIWVTTARSSLASKLIQSARCEVSALARSA